HGFAPLYHLALLLLYSSVHPPSLHSFPTRRSSDLGPPPDGRGPPGGPCPRWCPRAARPRHRSPPDGPRRSRGSSPSAPRGSPAADRKSTRLNSSHVSISYAVFCLKKKKTSCNMHAV